MTLGIECNLVYSAIDQLIAVINWLIRNGDESASFHSLIGRDVETHPHPHGG